MKHKERVVGVSLAALFLVGPPSWMILIGVTVLVYSDLFISWRRA